MKKNLKVITTIAVLVFTGINSFAQETKSPNEGIEIGTIILDPYIGLPVGGFGPDISLEYYGSTAGTEPSGLPVSFGGRFDYIATETLGIGVDVNYASYGYTTIDTSFNNEFDNISVTKFRVMLRFNKYFIIRPDIMAYYGFGMGYRGGSRTETTAGKSVSQIFFPLDGRLAMGVRYYFNQYIGVHAETGIGGGGVMQVGISARF